jgi:polyphenol oxidase
MSSLALMSPLLTREAFCHAFFTRQGGASRPPFESRSFVLGTGDTPQAVQENRRRAAEALGIRADRLYYLSQVHGIEAVELTGDESPEEVIQRRGDITLSRSPEVGCGVRSADCAPILIGDRETGAVAAVHSGWRGTVARVAEAAVRALCDAACTSPAALVAAIGPHIERGSFEVGRDVAEQLAACSTAGTAVVLEGRDEEHPLVDLRAILRAQLRTAGLSDDAIDDVAGCTVSQPDLFFSYRRDGKIGGRLLSAIAARRP